MTAKELLHERIEALSEEECERLLASFRGDSRRLLTPASWNDEPPEERAERTRRAIRELADLVPENPEEESQFPLDWPASIERSRFRTSDQW